MQITKTYVYTLCVGDFYNFDVYKITDAAKQVWYMATPVTHGATRTADTIEELRAKLEADVPIINSFLKRTR